MTPSSAVFARTSTTSLAEMSPSPLVSQPSTLRNDANKPPSASSEFNLLSSSKANITNSTLRSVDLIFDPPLLVDEACRRRARLPLVLTSSNSSKSLARSQMRTASGPAVPVSPSMSISSEMSRMLSPLLSKLSPPSPKCVVRFTRRASSRAILAFELPSSRTSTSCTSPIWTERFVSNSVTPLDRRTSVCCISTRRPSNSKPIRSRVRCPSASTVVRTILVPSNTRL
mmetsp:Transcript_15121/g.32512  ORF Transcript_15121/g.32512 Transcript_15121/m.32512 type:complete len:228 (+) Transcript_15121:666-1349(+)